MDPKPKENSERPPERVEDNGKPEKERKSERGDELPPPEHYPPVVEYDD